MVLQGEFREDHPAQRIFFKVQGEMLLIFRLFFDIEAGVAVVDPGGGAENYGRSVFVRKYESFLDHLIGFLNGGRIENGKLAVFGESPGVLLGLRGDGARVVGDEDHHGAPDTDVGKAHKRVAGHVQAHLLHGDKHPGAGIGRSGGRFQGGFLVDGPLDVGFVAPAFCYGLQNFRGGRPRISGR